MKRVTIFIAAAALSAAIYSTAAAAAVEKAGAAKPAAASDEKAPAAKASAAKADSAILKVEMRALDRAYKALVDALVLNDPKLIEGPLKEFEKSRGKVEKAIEAGTLLPPKGGSDMKSFKDMDEKFHQKFDAVAKAGMKGDMKSLYRGVPALLHMCVRCHGRYR